MTAIFRPEGRLFRATEHMLQGSAATAPTTREVERMAPDYHRCVRSRDLRALPVPELTSAAAIKLNKQA